MDWIEYGVYSLSPELYEHIIEKIIIIKRRFLENEKISYNARNFIIALLYFKNTNQNINTPKEIRKALKLKKFEYIRIIKELSKHSYLKINYNNRSVNNDSKK